MLRPKGYGKHIRLLRDTHCWAQQQLARAAGYSIKTISKVKASYALKRQTLADIARAIAIVYEASSASRTRFSLWRAEIKSSAKVPIPLHRSQEINYATAPCSHLYDRTGSSPPSLTRNTKG